MLRISRHERYLAEGLPLSFHICSGMEGLTSSRIGSTPQALNSAAKGGVAGLVAGFLQAQLLPEAGQENVCKMLKSPP